MYLTSDIFCDQNRAIDTVDHCILLDKLRIYGVRGVPWKWFESYFSSHHQYATIHTRHGYCQSEIKWIPSTVPQGSILGPFLFNLYFNYLQANIQYLQVDHSVSWWHQCYRERVLFIEEIFCEWQLKKVCCNLSINGKQCLTNISL